MAKSFATAYLYAKYPALAVETREEERLIRVLLNETYPDDNGNKTPYTVFVLDATRELRRARYVEYDVERDVPGHVAYESVNPGKPTQFGDAVDRVSSPDGSHTILVWLDSTFMLTQPEPPRTLLKNLRKLANVGSCVVLAAQTWAKMPSSLKDDVPVVRFDLPTGDELDEALDIAISAAGEEVDATTRERLRGAVTGLPYQKITNVLCHSYVTRGKWDPIHVADAKMDQVRQSGFLTMANPVPVESVGGLANYKEYITEEVMYHFGHEVKGVRRILLVGVQGTGKSLSAKALAAYLQVPLVEFNLGKCKGSLVGETEHNTEEALNIIKAIGKCVVWIDEAEDQTGDAASSAKTGSTTGAQVGIMATWMQDKQPADVILVLTANNYHAIPLKWVRRMDETFFVDLPRTSEREEIAAIHLKRVGETPTPELCQHIAAVTSEFNGGEVEKLVISAARRAKGGPITPDIVTAAVSVIKPISVTRAEEIAALRKWGHDTVRIANSDESVPAQGKPSANGKRVLHHATT